MLRGSTEILTTVCLHLGGIKPGETTKDGKFTVVEVECQGACSNAPMMAIAGDFYVCLFYNGYYWSYSERLYRRTLRRRRRSGYWTPSPRARSPSLARRAEGTRARTRLVSLRSPVSHMAPASSASPTSSDRRAYRTLCLYSLWKSRFELNIIRVQVGYVTFR